MTVSFPQPAGVASFQVHVEPAREVVVLIPEGELDLHTLPQLAAAVDELREVGFTQLRLDLGRLGFIDSSGVHFLLSLAGDDGVHVELLPAPSAVQRVFSLSQVEHLLPFQPRR